MTLSSQSLHACCLADTIGGSAILLIPQRSIALEWLVLCSSVFMLKKSTALEWLALCLVHCVLDVDATLTCRFCCRLDDVHHWQDDLHHYFDFCLFKNLEYF